MCVANCQRFHIFLFGVNLSCFEFLSKLEQPRQRRGNSKHDTRKQGKNTTVQRDCALTQKL